MTAGSLINVVDSLRPNDYASADKLRWLQRLDRQLWREILLQHEIPDRPDEPTDAYTAETELLAKAPYDEELYTAYLFAQIDLNNAEIEKYNQSAALFTAAWKQYAGDINRRFPPVNAGGWRL